MQKLTSSLFVLLALSHFSVNAEDLFNNDFERSFQTSLTISDSVTVGGYPIYTGGRNWKILRGKAEKNNTNSYIGYANLISPMNGIFFIQFNYTVNLENSTGYYTSEPCKGTHLYSNNLGGGWEDNCMTINVVEDYIAGNPIAALKVNVRVSKSGSRLYDMMIFINLKNLGFSKTYAAEWTSETLRTSNQKKLVIEKVSAWAKKLQAGANKAIDFSKPKDAFADVPPIDDLLQLAPVESVAVPIVAPPPAPVAEVRSQPVDTTPVETSPAFKSLKQRLSELKSLLDSGLISKEQYEQKSTEIIKEF